MTKPQHICICGSMAFFDEMEAFATELRKAGYTVDTPVREEVTIDWDSLSNDESRELKKDYIDGHLAKIRQLNIFHYPVYVWFATV